MARRKPKSQEDRLAARLARLGGVALSADDLDNLDLGDDDTGNNRPGADRLNPIKGRDGKLNTEGILTALLSALGINVPVSANEAEFKRTFAQACLEKIRELTAGKARSGANNNHQPGNPLIPGGGEISPMYMSLDRMHHQNAELRAELSRLPVAADPSPERIEELAAMMAKRMGAVPEQGVPRSA